MSWWFTLLELTSSEHIWSVLLTLSLNASVYGVSTSRLGADILPLFEVSNNHRLYNYIFSSYKFIHVQASKSNCYIYIYGEKQISEKRNELWLLKTLKRAHPKLQLLPPTTVAFKENVKRAHLQYSLWKSVVKGEPPALDPCDFGWIKDDYNPQVTIPQGVQYMEK